LKVRKILVHKKINLPQPLFCKEGNKKTSPFIKRGIRGGFKTRKIENRKENLE